MDRSKIYVRLSQAFILSALLTGCILNSNGDSDRRPESLSKAKQLWESHEIRNYSIDVKRICFCGGPLRYRLTVREDTVAQITDLESGEVFTTNLAPYQTVDDQFAWLERVIEMDPEVLEVEYHPTYGYPGKINYDQSSQISDEGLQLEMSNLKQ
ncbi:MAG: hypothetical protein GVY20_11950 [Bacteroidetes bacterium]|nr:hypothetical protein [Bacteroidota bacterium]